MKIVVNGTDVVGLAETSVQDGPPPPDPLHVFKAELRKLLATIRREQSNLDRLNRYTHLTRSMRDDRNLSCDRIADANRRIEEMLR